MKVLITGAGGDVGIAISERLISSNCEVVAYDLRGEHLPTGVRFVDGDVRDFEHLARVAQGCDGGIHLAALAGEANAEEILSVNVLGAYGFLLAARKAGFRNSVIASSASTHLAPSEFDHGSLMRTSDGDDHAYDMSKALQEMIGRDFHSHGLSVQCLRFGHIVLGKEETNLRRTTTLHDEQYCRGGWVALEDVVDACNAALKTAPATTTFEILNVVGAKAARDRFQVARAEGRLGIKLKYDFSAFE
jgi:nucleoside-diphosphate-sugar epimerase